MEKLLKLKVVMAVLALLLMCACGGGGGGHSSSSTDGNGGDDDFIEKVYGLNFSVYTKPGQNPNQGTILSESQIKSHLVIIAPYTEWIRIFGMTLGMEKAPKIAFEMGLSTATGVWLDGNLVTNDKEMQNLFAAARDGHVCLAIIGSETLYRGDLTVEELIGYIEQFHTAFPNIPVTTAETYGEWLNHPELFDHVDVVLANYYPYWEGIHIDEAMAYLHNRHQRVVAKAGELEVIVSETGWPSEGDTIDQAVPNPENAAFFFLNFVSWAKEEGVDYYYFEAFDEPWKAGYEGPQGAHWGVWTSDGDMKPDMIKVFDGETIANNWTSSCVPGGPGVPEIEFTYVPPKGSNDNLEGQVWHVDAYEHGVAVYIYVGGWWTKPYWNDPVTEISCSGRFVTDITTGGVDNTASKIAAFLIPLDYYPPSLGTDKVFPQELYDNALDYIIVDR